MSGFPPPCRSCVTCDAIAERRRVRRYIVLVALAIAVIVIGVSLIVWQLSPYEAP